MNEDQALVTKFATILPQLNERQRRLVLAAEARAVGRGGVTRAAGVTRPTIHAALQELDQPALPSGRVRQVGGSLAGSVASLALYYRRAVASGRWAGAARRGTCKTRPCSQSWRR